MIQEYVTKKVPFFVLTMQNELVDNAIRAAGVVTEKSISSADSRATNPYMRMNLPELYGNLMNINRKDSLNKDDLNYVVEELNKVIVNDSNLSETAKKKTTAASIVGAELNELCKRIRTELEYATNVRDEFDRVIQSKMKEVIWKISIKNTNLAYNTMENLKMEDFSNLSSISDL